MDDWVYTITCDRRLDRRTWVSAASGGSEGERRIVECVDADRFTEPAV